MCLKKEKQKGFLRVVGWVLAAVGAAFFLIFRRRGLTPSQPPVDRSTEIDRKRKAEEEKIRESIKKETDQQLADRFNRLAECQKSKEEEK